MAAPALGGGGVGQYTVVMLGPLTDRHGNQLGLHECLYGPLASKRMVKREPKTVPPLHYRYLLALEHPTMLSVYDFVVDGSEGCLVLDDCVDQTFKTWAGRAGRNVLFTQSPDAANRVRLGQKLRKLILELASLVERLIQKGYHPVGLDISHLFIKFMQVQGPTLKVLLSYNVSATQAITTVGSTWTVFREVIDHCCRLHGVQLDYTSRCFRNYIGRHSSARQLEAYPDTWSDTDKINYILLIAQGEETIMEKAINKAQIDWPLDPKDQFRAAPIIDDIYRHHVVNKINYTWSPSDYMRLCRNVLKYFEVPPNVLLRVRDRFGFLRKMEQFHPRIWTSLYEQIGPLGEQLN